jgi:hypothetical protein
MQHSRTVSSFPDRDSRKLRSAKTFFAPHAVVLLSYPWITSVSDNPYQVYPSESFASHDALIRQQLLSNIEQS